MISAVLETQSGTLIDIADPQPDQIYIRDIAHALSMQCRFGGHTKHHYSVAQHSVNVSYLVPKEHALQALLHDATEAYLVDIPTPIKRLLRDYKPLEERLWSCIAAKYGVPKELHASVKEADSRICISEKIELISPNGLDGPGWIGLTSVYKPLTDDQHATVDFGVYTPGETAEIFLQRFAALMLER